MPTSRFLNIAAIGFLLGVVILVFVQIETSMKEQGIASGGPYDNAASYPRNVAIFVGILLLIQAISEFFRKTSRNDEISEIKRVDLQRAGLMLLAFAVYLLILTTVGYHLATTPLIFAIMWICGSRQYLKMAFASFAIAMIFAFAFERFLNVVLPLGIWSIFIPW